MHYVTKIMTTILRVIKVKKKKKKLADFAEVQMIKSLTCLGKVGPMTGTKLGCKEDGENMDHFHRGREEEC